MKNTTMIKMDFYEAGWRCVLEEGMEQCVMTSGTIRMALWSADSLDFPHMVSNELHAGSSIAEIFINFFKPTHPPPPLAHLF